MPNKHLPLILASGSRYRRIQLEQLGLIVEGIAPEIDESPLEGEAPVATSLRLARNKAISVKGLQAHRWILAGDQTAECEGQPLGKPGSVANAVAQLIRLSGRLASFHSAYCLLGPDDECVEGVITTNVQLRQLDIPEIESYIAAEQPLDCCGSFKVEGRGIALFEWIRSDDPTALIGLPLIAVSTALRRYRLL